MRGNNGRAKGRQAAQNANRTGQMRDELKQAVAAFLQKRMNARSTRVSDEQKAAVADIAYVTARARTGVTRDRFTREVEYLPVAEDPGRLTIQLIKLLTAVAIANGHAEVQPADLAFIQRVADDCLPPDRLKVIEVMRTVPAGQCRTVVEVCKIPKTWMPETSVRRCLEDLAMLDVVECIFDDKNTKSYRLKALST